jgi:hypothetical protein
VIRPDLTGADLTGAARNHSAFVSFFFADFFVFIGYLLVRAQYKSIRRSPVAS